MSQNHWRKWQTTAPLQVPLRLESPRKLRHPGIGTPRRRQHSFARALRRNFYDQLPGLRHPTPRRFGFCDAIGCRFETTRDARVKWDVRHTRRRHVSGTTVRLPTSFVSARRSRFVLPVADGETSAHCRRDFGVSSHRSELRCSTSLRTSSKSKNKNIFTHNG